MPLDPDGILPVRNGEAESVKQTYLERVQNDQLAVVAPHAKAYYMDGEVEEQAQIGQVVVPEENAFGVVSKVDVTILVIVVPPTAFPIIFIVISIIGLLLLLLSLLILFLSKDKHFHFFKIILILTII